ncbi:hypothetical protein M409DRAFT_57556 [Zasmidium cellare ATCC 36951]|uniref:Clavaminate synthase-like protein n=1 Tax=Zasmidium cellare ATCC 36951 TaxID=1080233 RepID=A0A6A6CBG5_ZASCE|nr:uncharacterized protein M409DRAFT_57556 [Zasmidium cellare ATCC 36951]KAF2163262.1 hypothetical protein M409DRAFT_57556 [Zasmidium cellare ATCC 36951]
MMATTLSLKTFETGSVPFPTLEEAFGPSSLGILIVSDLPPQFAELRRKLLSHASYLAQLPSEQLDALTNVPAHYEIGWSHGVEKLKDGQYDTMKGSFYVDCQSFYLDKPTLDLPRHPSLTRGSGQNLWPSEAAIPGFRAEFEELCTLLIDIGALVARAIDLYAVRKIPDYGAGFLERVVRTSHTPKARLLHYFPPASGTTSEEDEDEDSWCATHLDDGCLTALISALFVDESDALPPLVDRASPPTLNILPKSPDPAVGLYIGSREGTVVKVNTPEDSIAFQTGEALEKITGGRFRAVPHFVRGPNPRGAKVARNTLALFMQPDLDEVIDKAAGLTYGEFVDAIVEKHA